MSDIMDEFEFKPLTNGLGFHKKPNSEIKQTLKAELTTDLKSPLTPTLPRNSLEKIPLTTDLPTTSVDEILKTLNQRKRPDITNRIDNKPEKPSYKSTSWNASAFLLDLMLVLAMNLACLIALLVTTKIDLFANLYKPDADNMIYLSLAGMTLSVTWIYLVATRMFLGCTPGEWVFDQRLGLPEETGSAMYSLLVMARATLLVFTGLILFPLISTLSRRDILGRLMGLELMKKT